MRFEKNKKKRKINIKVIATSLIAITLIGIVGISVGKNIDKVSNMPSSLAEPINFLQENLNKGFVFLKDNLEDIINFRKNAEKIDLVEEENTKLKEEIIKLKSQLSKVDSLKNLEKSLNYVKEDYMKESISASIVSKNDGNWYTSFTIGAGEDDGVKKDSIVINGDGLVGVVYEVSKNYSKAISILDTKSSVSFKLPNNQTFKGIITQNANIDNMEIYKNEGYLYGYMFDTSYEVLPGDVVVTSGLGIYPEDILIGEIDKVIDDKNQSMKYVVIKPYVNFKDIEEVIILNPRDIK